MLKKLFFLMFFCSLYSQENKISINPNNLNNTSAICIKTIKKGNYTLKIIDNKNEVIFSKNLFIDKTFNIKYNFKKLDKGEYSFVLSNRDEDVYTLKKIKK